MRLPNLVMPFKTRRLAAFMLAGLLVLTLSPMLTVQAASSVVGSGTPASCTDSALSSALNGGGLITFNCGPNPHTINLAPAAGGTGTKTINLNTTLDGGGKITISGGNAVRIFRVNPGLTFTIQNLSIVNGRVSAPDFSNGGGIYSTGSTLNLANTTFSANYSDASGGAIATEGGILNVSRSTFFNNWTSFDGGAIYAAGERFNLSNSTFYSNRSDHAGGAISASGNLVSEVKDSTFFDNSTDLAGAAIHHVNFTTRPITLNVSGSTFYNNARAAIHNGTFGTPITANIVNSTFYNNTQGYHAGGIDNNNFGGSNITVSVTNTTFSNNSGGAVGGDGVVTLRNSLAVNNLQRNCSGTVISEGGNLQFPGTDCGTTIPSTNPFLDPLANNGGPTLTMRLPASSPAIGAGVSAFCPPTDQRGVTRPAGQKCDSGAYQTDSEVKAPIITITFKVTSLSLGDTTGLSFTLTNPNSNQSLTGLGFSDNMPAGLVVAGTPAITNNCGGTILANPNTPNIRLGQGKLEAGKSCVINLKVKATSLGLKKNITEPVSAKESGPGIASNLATLVVKPSEQLAVLRFAQLAPFDDKVDVYLNRKLVLKDLSFGTVSEYLTLKPGNYAIDILKAGTKLGNAAPLISEAVDLWGGEAYTYSAHNFHDHRSTYSRLYQDDVTTPTANRARMRVIQASPDAEVVEVALQGGPVLTSPLANGESSEYFSLEAGTYRLEVREVGTGRVLYLTPALQLEAGSIYSAVVQGQLQKAAHNFSLNLVNDVSY